jgi:ribA/ribD-fused uncharacterized protein
MKKSILFGGNSSGKRYPNGKNYHGNDFEATRFLSNYAELQNPVVYEGVSFPTVEQAYVAAKFNSPAVSEFIAGLGPGVNSYGRPSVVAQHARDLGRSSNPGRWRQSGWEGEVPRLRDGWNDEKVEVMRDLVRQKFENNPEFGDYLRGTGDAQLIEHTTGWGDRVWGMVDPTVGKRGMDAQVERLEGENHLGRLLMELRDQRLQEAAVAAPPAAAVAVVPPAAAPVQLELPVGQGPRMAGDAWPWIAAAGGGSLLAAAAVMALQEQEEERAYPQVQQSYGT